MQVALGNLCGEVIGLNLQKANGDREWTTGTGNTQTAKNVALFVGGRKTAVTGTNILGGLKRLAKRCKRRRPTEQATQSSKGSEYKRRWNRAKHQLDRNVVEKQKGKGAPLTVLWGNPAKASVAKIQEKQAVDESPHTPLVS